jgi:hypothetical protein
MMFGSCGSTQATRFASECIMTPRFGPLPRRQRMRSDCEGTRIEAGAVANLVVWSADPLQASTRVEHVFVRGREQSLETPQTLLLERYRTLPVLRSGEPQH